MQELRQFIIGNEVKSIAIASLGAGNSGLDEQTANPTVEMTLADLTEVNIVIYESI